MKNCYDPLASVQAAGPPGTISFVYGLSDPNTFPIEKFQTCFDHVFKSNASLALQYGPEQGYGPLIDYLRGRFKQKENIDLVRAQIMLTGGASQALDHICSLFTKPGEAVIVEAPTYNESLKLFNDHGLNVFSVDIDKEGIKVGQLETILKRLKRKRKSVRFLYTIPNFQNPSGISISLARKKAVLEVIKDWDLYLVEDDVYSELAYEEKPPPSYFSLDNTNRVLRLGSFSKILAPGLRLGWLIAPPPLINLLVGSGLRRMGGGSNPLIANVISYFCSQGWLEPHLKFIRAHYKLKRDIMFKSLETFMPQPLSWTKPKGGFFIWLKLPPSLKVEEVVGWAQSSGILVLSGNDFFARPPQEPYLRLAFSFLNQNTIEEGIAKLANVIKSHLERESS
ncbi:MAG: PLP-dependent aminotransferase family protein [Candidatus Aminicenantales bacterium]